MYRHLCEVIGFTGDAEIVCPSCAVQRYKAVCTRCGMKAASRLGEWHDKALCDAFREKHPDRHVENPHNPGYFAAWDAEGNEVTAYTVEHHTGDDAECCAECEAIIE